MFSSSKLFRAAPIQEPVPENSEPGTLWAWGTASIMVDETPDDPFGSYLVGMFGNLEPRYQQSHEYRKPVQIGGKYASRFGDHKWLSVSSNGGDIFAIREDKTLWAWGNNTYGIFADGTNTTRANPVQVGGVGSKWKEVSCSYHVLAIRDDGTLWSWGLNNYGQLGDGGIAPVRYNPYKIGNDTWISVSACENNSYAIKSDGTLWGWGYNQLGDVGIGTIGLPISTPTRIGSESNWQTLTRGRFALKNNGTLWCWGGVSNSPGRELACCETPPWLPIATPDGCSGRCFIGPVCTAQEYVDALNCWCPECRYVAYNPGTQYEYIDYDKRPVKVPGSNWSSNFNGIFGIKSDGTLWTFNNPPTPVSWPNFPPETQWSKVDTVGNYSAAIRQDGTLWMWGDNNKWQCAGDIPKFDQEIKQVGSATWSKVYCFGNFTMAIR